MDLKEAEDIQKRRQEYTEDLYKKDIHDPDNHDCVISHLEPDILEYEVKWASGSITMNKASRGDGIPGEIFQILKWWCCESAELNMPANWENSAVAIGVEKISFHSFPKERQWQITLISHASKVMLKILHARLQQYVNCELQDVHTWKAEIRAEIANISWITEKAKEFQINFCFIDYAKTLDYVDNNKLGNS